MIKNVYCKRCGHKVKRETTKGLRKEYPYYCPCCDENMYRFETVKHRFEVKRMTKKRRRKHRTGFFQTLQSRNVGRERRATHVS